MRDLAGSVGVEAASLYNHIRSKSELLHEICFRIANQFTAQLNELESDGAMDSLDKVEAVLRFHIRIWVEKLDEVLVTTNESRHLEEPYLSAFLNERRVYVRRLETIIEDGIRKGQVRRIEPYVAVLTLMSAVRGIEFWHRTKKNVTAQQLEESMVSNLIAGLKK
jgi:AcrR family transcriptional regulator